MGLSETYLEISEKIQFLFATIVVKMMLTLMKVRVLTQMVIDPVFTITFHNCYQEFIRVT